MTREEIRDKTKNKYPYIKGLPQTLAHQEIFIEGAKWTNKTMIEKACEWLDINFPNIDNVGSWYKEGFIKQFKKAMEE